MGSPIFDCGKLTSRIGNSTFADFTMLWTDITLIWTRSDTLMLVFNPLSYTLDHHSILMNIHAGKTFSIKLKWMLNCRHQIIVAKKYRITCKTVTYFPSNILRKYLSIPLYII